MHIKSFLSMNAIFLCALYHCTGNSSKHNLKNNVNLVAISHIRISMEIQTPQIKPPITPMQHLVTIETTLKWQLS